MVGLQVAWSDGHKSLYPYAAFLKSRRKAGGAEGLSGSGSGSGRRMP